nr:hypothetical protein [Actinomyces sp.]
MDKLTQCAGAVLVGALLAVSGCSMLDHEEEGTEALSDVIKDQLHWTLPTDPYSPARDQALELQAFDTVRAPCMRDAGFAQVEIGWDASAPAPATLAGDGVSQVFNEDVAGRYGYRMAPDSRNLNEAATLAAGEGGLWAHESQAFWDALYTCHDKADVALTGKDLEESQDDASQTSAITSELDKLRADTTAPDLADAAAAWRTCMAPQGIIDLPAQPWTPGAMLPDSLMQRWDWAPTGTASADEIQVASADATCRRTSGWFDALYEAEWNLRQAFVDEHRTELEPVRQALDTARERYRSLIAGTST